MDNHTDNHFLIVSTGYNCADRVRLFYESMRGQTYQNFDCIIINDASTDNTKQALIDLKNQDDRFELFSGSENRGAAYRRWEAIKALTRKKINKETILVFVGLDDTLKPNALETANKAYTDGIWMSYGNWIAQDGYMLPDGFLDYSDQIHRDRSYRKDVFRATGMTTLKKFLFDQFKEEDFKFQGEWVKATTESNLMFSCLEMCGKDRIAVIYEPIVNYFKGRPDNARRRLGDKYQDSIFNDVINKPKRELL